MGRADRSERPTGCHPRRADSGDNEGAHSAERMANQITMARDQPGSRPPSLSHKSPSKFVLRPAGSHATAMLDDKSFAESTCPSCLWENLCLQCMQCDKLHISDSFHSYISLPRALTQFLTCEFEPALPANKCSGIEMQMLSATCAAKPTGRWGVGLPL